MEAVLISAGAVLALLDADHPQHAKALRSVENIKDRKLTPLLTNYIVAETFSLLSAYIGSDAGRTWLRHNIWPVERVNEGDELRAREIVLGDYYGNMGEDISYIDATTLAVMERLGVAEILEGFHC